MTELDWDRLQRLRQRFLAADDSHRTTPDYWGDARDLQVYDQVLAERIGWKWDAVLSQVAEVDFLDKAARPQQTRILDWGCGTGVAAHRFAQRFGSQRILLHDRSAAAMGYAQTRLRSAFPDADVREYASDQGTPDILLLSHVLGELDDRSEAQLLELVQRCPRVLWVDAGTRSIARRLSKIRDRLLDRYEVVAPCPHQAGCPTLRDGDQHWCHLFAKPPADVFMDRTWAEIGRRLKIDLRALPYHFLAMVQRDPRGRTKPQGARLIGRPEIRNKFLRFYQCDEAGITDRTVFKGQEPELYKRIKKTGSL